MTNKSNQKKKNLIYFYIFLYGPVPDIIIIIINLYKMF